MSQTTAQSDPIEYRGYFIEPKCDFGRYGYYVPETRSFTWTGFVVVQGPTHEYPNSLVLPGATWAHTVEQAGELTDILIAVQGDADSFWEVVRARQERFKAVSKGVC